MAIKERIESMEKFFLGTLFSAEKLNVVNQEQVSLAITFPEFDQVVVLDRVDELVDEEFAGKINHFRVLLFRHHVLPDRLHQVRFAKTDAAVNKERVVGARRRLRNRETGRMRDFVVRSNDERFECIARIKSEQTAAGRFGFANRLASSRNADRFDHLNRRLRGNEFNFARLAESSHYCSLQRRHVITFDPILIDVVRDTKAEGLVCRTH